MLSEEHQSINVQLVLCARRPAAMERVRCLEDLARKGLPEIVEEEE